jgi:hypothetical protein
MAVEMATTKNILEKEISNDKDSLQAPQKTTDTITKEFRSAKQLEAWIEEAVSKQGEVLYKIVSVDWDNNSVEAIRLSRSDPGAVAIAKKHELEREAMLKKYDRSEESFEYWRTRK